MRTVAIGMPVWNGEKFLAQAIESVLGQTYGDLELVISDNASTDATPEICRAYAEQDGRITYIRQDRNIGAGPNHDAVLRRSSGRYFKWACHDDVLAPEFLEHCVRVLDMDEAVVVCCPATVLINEDGSPLRYSPQDGGMVDNYGTVWRIEKKATLTSADPAERFATVLCNVDWCFEIYGLMRRSAVERISPMPSYYGGDKVLLAELGLLGRYHLLETPLFYRRCHPGQSSAPQKTGRYKATWISGRKRQILPPEVKLTAAYMRAVLRAELTAAQRLHCFAAIGRRAVEMGVQGPMARHNLPRYHRLLRLSR